MLNKAQIIGNLGGDPEVRYTNDGTAVASINVATTEKWTDKQSGEKQERTEWHRVTVWGKLAEICGEYLHKGSKVYFEGKLQTDKYTDKDGIERYTTKIVASNMEMLDSKPAGEGQQRQGGGQQQRSQGGGQGKGGSYGNQSGGQQRSGNSQPADTGFADDEIPF